MGDRSLAFALLASVTSPERAAAIEGDLLEQRGAHGAGWFALHVIRTTVGLFGVALAVSPFRTAALSVAAVSMSCLMCRIADSAFFGRDAWIPAPGLGFLAVVAFAFLLGSVLVYSAGALGVRAAAAASGLLILMFTVAYFTGRFETAGAELGVLRGLGTFATNLAFAVCVYLGPLMTASAIAHVRRL